MKTTHFIKTLMLAGLVCIAIPQDAAAAERESALSRFAERDADLLTTPGRVKRGQSIDARDTLARRLSGQLQTTAEQGIQDRQRELRRREMRRMIQKRIRETATPVLANSNLTRPILAKDAQEAAVAVTRQDAARQVLSDYRASSVAAYTRGTTSRLRDDTSAVSLARTASGSTGRGSVPILGVDPRLDDIQGLVRRPSPRRHPDLPVSATRTDGTAAAADIKLSADRPTATRPTDTRVNDTDASNGTRTFDNASIDRSSSSLR